MNNLIEHGIQTEDADIRAHVGVLARSVFVFRTLEALETLNSGIYREATATQTGVQGITGKGWLVPIGSIHDLRILRLSAWPQWVDFRQEMSTSEKGALAVCIVLALIERGRFPFWADCEEDKTRDIQVKGTDIIVGLRSRIQVKCDWKAGPKEIAGCSGNLFLQNAERNPLRRI